MLRPLLALIFSIALTDAFESFKHATHIRDKKDLLSEYDFVVVGGGASGLTVADRLTEDASSETSPNLLSVRY